VENAYKLSHLMLRGCYRLRGAAAIANARKEQSMRLTTYLTISLVKRPVCCVSLVRLHYNATLCKIAWGWIFWGAFFGVCRKQLFGFCPRVPAFVGGGKRQCAAAGRAKNVTQKRQRKGRRGWDFIA